MKRFLSILLAVVMIMSMAVPAFAFTDIEDSDYAEAITYLTGLNVIAGYEDGTFKPEKVVTRAEMAKLLVVCLGLEPGAALLEGTTSFDDVPATHWATGYIAVATQYGLIKGDGDGNFRPDDTVNVAEAATMILRALGYNRVVDKTGEWPTNYLNKANELKIFEDVETFKGTDGATRGMIAQMMWNMMNTRMWDIAAESEGDGLTYGKLDTMLETKFPKYEHKENLIYEGYQLNTSKKNEVQVQLNFDEGNGLYAGNDFYTFVPGTIFEALVFDGKDGEEVVALFATDDQYLVDGTYEELSEKYDEIDDLDLDAADYIYAILDTNKKTSDFAGSGAGYIAFESEDSMFVEEIEENKDGFTVLDGEFDFDFDEDDTWLVLFDDERVDLEEIEEKDVITFVGNKVLVITRDATVEGEVNKYVSEDRLLTLGDEKYYVSNTATCLVDEDDEDSEAELWGTATFADFKGEDGRAYLDVWGNVVRLSFGKLTEEASNGAFYVIASDAWSVSDEDGSETKIKLTNLNGVTKTYTFAENVEIVGDNLESILDEIGLGSNILEFVLAKMKNTLVWVEFDDDEISSAAVILAFSNPTPSPMLFDTYDGKLYDGILDGKDISKVDTDDIFEPDWLSNVSYKDGYLCENTTKEAKVTNSTLLVKLITDVDDDHPTDANKATYKVEVETGKDAFKGISGDALVYTAGEFDTAKYVFVYEDSTTSDLLYGIVENIENDKVNDEMTIELTDENGKTVEYVVSEASEVKAVEGTAIAYTLNSKDEVVIKEVARPIDFKGALEVETVDDDKRSAKMVGISKPYALDDEETADVYDEYTVIVAKVGYDEDDDNFGGYVFTGFEVISYDDLKFAKKDFLGEGKNEDLLIVYKLSNVAYNEQKAE